MAIHIYNYCLYIFLVQYPYKDIVMGDIMAQNKRMKRFLLRIRKLSTATQVDFVYSLGKLQIDSFFG